MGSLARNSPSANSKSGEQSAKGAYVTQMVKHNALPMNAMILSNAGKTMDIHQKTTTIKMRIAIFITPRKYIDRPTRPELSETVCWCKPKRTSMVDTMGRAFRGIFVSGMMATNMAMRGQQ